MDIKRVLTGLIGFPIIAIILIFSNVYFFDGVIALFALISIYEFYNSFTTSKKAKPISYIGYISCIGIALIHIIPKEYLSTISLIILPILIVILFLINIIDNKKINIIDISVTLFGILYNVVFWAFISIVREMYNGKILVWYIFMSAWGTDILAYIIGKYFGKHKFSEISPKKTIEGCIAGLFGAIIFVLTYTIIINTTFNFSINYLNIIILSVVFSIIGQIGDFAASSIKRYTEIKDFGNLLPGHGGLLDRFDSVIFIAPFAYLLLTIIPII